MYITLQTEITHVCKAFVLLQQELQLMKETGVCIIQSKLTWFVDMV